MSRVLVCAECSFAVEDRGDVPVGWLAVGGVVLCDACRPDLPVEYQRQVAELVEAARALAVKSPRLTAALEPWMPGTVTETEKEST